MPRGGKRKVTPEHAQQMAVLYHQGQTTYEIAAQFRVSPHPVALALRRQGVTLRRGAPRSNWTGSCEQKAAVVAAYQSGESILQITKRLRTRATYIISALNEAGVARRHPGSTPLLSEDTAAEIAADYRSGATFKDLAAKHGVSYVTIRNYLVRRGVELRSPRAPRLWTDERKAEAAERYRAGKSQQEIAAALGCSQSGVSQALRELGVLTRGDHPRRENHPSWKGGRVTTTGGYIRVKLSSEDAHLIGPNTNNYVPEHRLVMARKLGRPLLPGENPHHKNTIRSDNSPENLELWLSSQPSGGRVSDLVEWSLGLLDRYMPTALAADWRSQPRPPF